MTRRVILVAGVPGTGKSVVSSRLSRILGCRTLGLSVFVLERGLWVSYDAERRSFVIDEDGLVRELERLEWSCMIVDTHWVEPFIKAGYQVEHVILLRCNPRELIRRLERRGWPPRKVAENVESELLGVLVGEVLEYVGSRKVYEIDTTGRRVEDTVAEAYKAIMGRMSRCCIDWTQVLSEDELREVLRYIEAYNP